MLDILNIYTGLVPLLLLVVLGFVAGLVNVEKDAIIRFLLFIINPVTFFNIGLHTSSEALHLYLLILGFLLATILCLAYLKIFERIWPGTNAANILAFASGSNNGGYLGLPVAMLFFEPHIVGIYALALMGGAIYEYTIGAYVTARGNYSAKKALYQILTLPVMHAFFVGLLLNKLEIAMPEPVISFLDKVQVCYAVLGIALIGLSLFGISYRKVHWNFVFALLAARFIFSPLLTLACIAADVYFWQLYSSEVYYVMLLLSFMPPAITTVVFANMYNNSRTEAAISVLLGMILAMLVFPFLPH